MNLTKLYLIRHGETEENHQGILVGSTDVPLNDEGRKQALSLAQHVDALHVDSIFSSPLQRAVETAILTFGKDATIITDSSLCEYHFGDWEGMHFSDLAEKYPDLWRTWMQDWEKTKIPGAETFTSFNHRVIHFCEEILRDNPGKNVALVSHGGCIRTLLAHYLSGSVGMGYWRFKVENAAIAELEVAGSLPILTRFNYR